MSTKKTGTSEMEVQIRLTDIPEDILAKWQNIVNILARVLQVPTAVITRIDPPLIEVCRASLTEGNPYKNGEKVELARHYCESVILHRKRLMVNHSPSDPEWSSAPEIEYGMVSYMGYPLHWPTGEIFGTICVQDCRENSFGEKYEVILSEFRDIVETHLAMVDMISTLQKKNDELTQALQEVKTLRGMLPICSNCKKIRDDNGYWERLESYIASRSEATFTHGICPECAKELYPGYKKG